MNIPWKSVFFIMKIILQITWVAFNVSVNLCMLIITAIKMTRHPINDCPNTYDH